MSAYISAFSTCIVWSNKVLLFPLSFFSIQWLVPEFFTGYRYLSFPQGQIKQLKQLKELKQFKQFVPFFSSVLS